MNVYIYCADIYCEDCGKIIRDQLDREGLAPADPDDEYTYDSDEYPKGPYSDGGGEADCPWYCGDCGVFLGNPLTADGIEYVKETIQEGGEVAELWAEYYAGILGRTRPVRYVCECCNACGCDECFTSGECRHCGHGKRIRNDS